MTLHLDPLKGMGVKRGIRFLSTALTGLVISVLSVIFYSPFLQANDKSNIVGLGMGRTFTVTSRGVDALGINPANLAMKEEPGFVLALFPVGISLGTDFLDYGLYRRFFTGVSTDSGRIGYHLTEADKEEILSGFSSGRGTMQGGADLKLFGISFRISKVGSFGIAVTERINAEGVLAKDYVRFLFYGNPIGETFRFNNTAIRAWWLRDYSLSFAQSVENAFGMERIAFGVAVKHVHGFGYFAAEQGSSFFTTSSQNIVTGHSEFISRRAGADFFTTKEGASFTPFPAPSGKGWGFDLGLNARVNSFLSVGASITDLGSLRWTHNAAVRKGNGDFIIDDPFSRSQRDSLEQVLQGVEERVTGFETMLPGAVHLGVGIQLPGGESEEQFSPILFALDYTQGLNDMPGNSRRPRFSGGVEVRPFGWLPIRSGVSVGGSLGKIWAFGFGVRLGVLELDFATEDLLSLLRPNSARRLSAGVGMRLSF